MKIFFSLLITISSAFATEVQLSEYDWKLTDISKVGMSRQALFNKLDRKFIKLDSSICSNRALMWAWDMKTKYSIDSAKIFMFYTKKTGEVGRKTWWYHVAPVVNENGTLWVVDPGFAGRINGPITQNDWLLNFAGSTKCKEIKSGENDLIERMFYGQVFPSTTSYGNFDCYYRYVPGPYWTPASVAKNLLGVDEYGNPIRFERHEMNEAEVFQSCVEATTSSLGRIFGGGKKACRKYLGIE